MRKAQSKPYSYENPLKLKKKHQNSELERVKSKNGETYFHRELLQLSTKPNVNTRNTEEPTQFSFLKLKDQSEDCFALNLVSNPNLKPIEIKIALGINHLLKSLYSEEDGVVFICTTKKLNPESISEDDSLFTDSNFGFASIIRLPLCELLSESLNIKVSNGILNKTLKRLDSFHYLNVTPLTPDNVRYPEQTKSSNRRAYYKHISINLHMCSKNLSAFWERTRD